MKFSNKEIKFMKCKRKKVEKFLRENGNLITHPVRRKLYRHKDTSFWPLADAGGGVSRHKFSGFSNDYGNFT